ncbi:MAG: radical SAM protein [Desulfobacterales bacterium]|nr:MAG: radical SAM protein [Desulfobacterales bacterium]
MNASKKNRIKTNFQTPDTRHQTPETNNQQPASSIEYPVSSSQKPAARNRPFIIPIFLPHAGCPHQCIFCNQVSITGAKREPVEAGQIRSQIHEFLSYKTARRKPVQISFFGGNFLGLKTEVIKFYLALAADFVHQGKVDSIRFSTRPDTIDLAQLNIIADYPVATIELGVQSMNNHILALAKRGHTEADTLRAVACLKARNYNIGLQMMVGLPGDDEASSLKTAKKIADLKPDFVRIYPTVVLKNSRLASWYAKGTYRPLSLEDAVTQVKRLYLYFRKNNIQIIRMGLQASTDLSDGSTVLAGPYHPAFGHLVYSETFLDAACTAIKAVDSAGANVAIFVNPRRISIMRGLNNSNIEIIKRRFGFEKIRVVPDNDIEESSIKIDNGSPISCFAFGDENADLWSK